MKSPRLLYLVQGLKETNSSLVKDQVSRETEMLLWLKVTADGHTVEGFGAWR